MIFANDPYVYNWRDRLRIWGEPAPLAEQPTNFFESIITNLGIPEILMILAIGFIVFFALEALGQKTIGKMAIVIAVFSGVSTLCVNIATIFR